VIRDTSNNQAEAIISSNYYFYVCAFMLFAESLYKLDRVRTNDVMIVG
jgi:hypothetical protein